MRTASIATVVVMLLTVSVYGQATRPAAPQSVPAHIQDISVTVRAGESQGSGVIKTRDGINYVWTAAHVVSTMRKTREVIDTKTGAAKTVIEFDDPVVVKELVEDGRSVGKLEMSAEIIRYSDANTGDDIALLRLRKKNFVKASVEFYLEGDIPPIGTELFHCGSLKGQFGSNSLTTGVVSQIGRVLNTVYDQTTATAFPGSSGGGVYLKDGRYVGMLVRSAGETFNLFSPVRRVRSWAKRTGVEFALDDKVAVPDEATLRRLPVEDVEVSLSQATTSKNAPKTNFLDYKDEK